MLVDGVGGGVLEWFVEDNPEDWAEFDAADVAGTSTPPERPGAVAGGGAAPGGADRVEC